MFVVDPLPAVVVAVLVVEVAPVVPVLLGVVLALVVVPDEAVAAAVGAKPAPANVIAAIIAHSRFVRALMGLLLSLA